MVISASVLTVNAGSTITGKGGMDIHTVIFQNNGRLEAPGAIIEISGIPLAAPLTIGNLVVPAGDDLVLIRGQGAMSAKSIKLVSNIGGVDAMQSSVVGTVSGKGTRGFAIETSSSALTVSDIESEGFIVAKTPKNLTIEPGSATASLNAGQRVELRGATVDIGGTITGSFVGVTARQIQSSGLGSITANLEKDGLSGGGITLRSTSNGITIGGALTAAAAIDIIATGAGGITIKDNVPIRVNDGNLVIETTSGSIAIGSSVTIGAFTQSNPNHGNVTVAIGSVQEGEGIKPPNFFPNISNGGKIVYPISGLSAAGKVTLNAIGREINFSNSSKTATITFNGNDSVTADPPFAPVDLTSRSYGTPPTTQLAPKTGATINPAVNRQANGFALQDFDHAQIKQQPLNRAVSFIDTAQQASKIAEIAGILTSISESEANLLSEGNGVFQFSSGNALLDIRKNSSITCGPFLIHCKPGVTIQLGYGSDTGMCLRVLCDSSAKSVEVNAFGKQVASLQSGEQLVYAPSNVTTQSKIPGDRVAIRGKGSISSTPGTISVAEFSPASALSQPGLLVKLKNNNMPAYARLIKMAACLMVATSGHGQYRLSQHE